MCGLVGVLQRGTKKHNKGADMFMQLLYADAVRGMHGTGMMVIEKDNSMWNWKRGLAAPDFLGNRYTSELLDMDKVWGWLGHNRLATGGTNHSDKNAHPFDQGKVTLMHNGVLRNQYSYNKKHFEVDSEAAAYCLAHAPSYKEGLETLEGAFALLWWDNEANALYAARNKERPLWYVTTQDDTYTVIGSELKLLEWIMWRNDVRAEKAFEVKPGEILRFDLNKFRPEVEDTFRLVKPSPVSNFPVDTRRSNPLGRTNPAPALGSERTPTGTGAASKFLREKGLQLGQKVTFCVTNVFPQEYPTEEASKPLGLVHGKVGSITDFGVRSHKVNIERCNKGVLCTGEIVACAMPRQGSHDKPQLWLKNVIPFVEVITRNNIDEIAERTIDITKDMPVLLSNCHSKKRAGLSQSRFWHLTRHGCCNCTSPLSYNDLERIMWTPNDEPLCVECVFDLKEKEMKEEQQRKH